MKPVKAIWIAVVLFSLAMGLWQFENIQLIWREYSFFYKNFRKDKHYSPDEMYGLLVSPKLAKQSPEAALIARIWLGRFFSNPDQEIDASAEKLFENQNNKFLLVELVRNLCWRDSVIDPQPILRIVDRLIALEPDNANYHYIKCSLLLTDRKDNNIEDAIRELEFANTCRDYDFPYTGYRQQAIDAANKTKLARFILSLIGSSDEYNFAANDVWQKLMGQSKAAFTNGDIAKGMRITGALAKMQQCRLSNGDSRAIVVGNQRFSAGAYTFGYYAQPQGLELQRVNLTKEQAKENRLQLSALTTESIKLEKERSKRDMETERWKTILFFVLLPAVHAGEMFIAFMIGCLVIFLISAMRGFGEKNKIGLWGILLFIAACVYYFYIVKGFVLVKFLFDNLRCSCCYSHFAYFEWLMPSPVLLYFDSIKLVFVGLTLVGPVIVALVLWVSGYIKPKRDALWQFWYLRIPLALCVSAVAAVMAWTGLDPLDEFWPKYAIIGAFAVIPSFAIVTFAWWIFRWRITRLFLLTTFLCIVTLLTGVYRYVYYLPMIAFVLTAAVVAVVRPDEGSALKMVIRFFSNKPEVAAVRNKCLRLTIPFVVVYWLLFVALSPWVAKDIRLQSAEFLPAKQTIALSEPNQAYCELMSMFDANNCSKQDISHKLGLVMPEDLPPLLQKLKNKEFGDYYSYQFIPAHASKQERTRLEKQREHARRLNDDDLISAMRGCGRDTVGIITNFLDDPNADKALVARAKLGDSTVKVKLKQLLQSRLQSEFDGKQGEQVDPNSVYEPRPIRISEIINALACVSEPNEAAQQFLNYLEKQDLSYLISDDYYFFIGLSLLPTTQARVVIKAYLDKVSGWRPREERGYYRPDRNLYPLNRVAGLYCDRQIAHNIFKIMLLASEDEHYYFKSYDISPYFTIESAGLLKQGLESKNSDMRAWCVWQLRKIGYKFDIAELEKLMHDESWKVRANATFAGGKEVAPLAAKDKSAFVRLVGGF